MSIYTQNLLLNKRFVYILAVKSLKFERFSGIIRGSLQLPHAIATATLHSIITE